MLLRLSIHPQGLTPFEAAKAWHLRHVQKLPWRAVREQVRTSDGGHPRRYAVVNAVRRISEQRHTQTFRRTGTASTAYHRCGRKPVLSPQQKSAIVAFVKQWRSKRFCTAAYIVQELRLSCSKKAVTRALNAAGYQWRPVCKRGKLTDAQLAARKVFVDTHVDKPSSWWRQRGGVAGGRVPRIMRGSAGVPSGFRTIFVGFRGGSAGVPRGFRASFRGGSVGVPWGSAGVPRPNRFES